MRGRCRTRTCGSRSASRSASSPGPVRRGVVDDQDDVVGRDARRARARTAAHDRLEVLALVVGRAGSPRRARRPRSSRASRQYRLTLRADEERRDRRRPRRAGRPLRARRRGRLPGGRLPPGGARRSASRRARSRSSPREGRATELPHVGKTLEEKIAALLETGEIPQAVEAPGEVPRRAGPVHRDPGPGPEDGAQDPRRARHHDARRSCARRPQTERLRSDLRASGPKAEQNIVAALDRTPSDGPRRARCCCRRCSRSASRSSSALRAHPGRRPGRDRRQRAPHDRHLQGPRRRSRPPHDAAALTAGVHASWTWSPRCRSSGEAGARVVTHNGLAVDFRVVAPDQFGNVLQHLTGSKQHNVALREYAVRRGLHVSEYGIEDDDDGDDAHAARPSRRSTSCSASTTSSRSCARAAASCEAALEHTLPELVTEDGPARRPALPHDALGRAQHARADGRGGARRAATPTSPSPTTRPRSGSATTCSRTSCERRIEEVARAERGA